MNYNITNNTKRIVGLQKVALLLGVFGGPVQPGESLVVPSDYLKAMEGERSFVASVKSKDLTVSDTDAPAVPVSKAPPSEAKPKQANESDISALRVQFAAALAGFDEKLTATVQTLVAQLAECTTALAEMSKRANTLDAKRTELEGKVAEFELKLEAATKPKR